MKLTHPKIALYVGLVFASGVMLGGFGHRLYTVSSVDAKATVQKGPTSFKVRYMAEMQTRLNMSEAQMSKLSQIMDETRSRMDDWNAKVAEPEMLRIRNEQIDKIRQSLTPEQALGYDQLRRERDERAKAKAAQKSSQK